jgi:leucyl-tRNA synthetase
MEHTTLHLLYSRFWHKFLYDLKLVPTSEPYMKRTSHGMILAEGGEKMSKSKGNVINPDDIIKNYGADTLRVYEMFMGPFDQAVSWSTESIIGPRRFLDKIWRTGVNLDLNLKISDKSIEKLLHKTVKKITEDVENMNFNTAISAMMVFVNEVDRIKNISVKDFKLFLQILAPFAPHITEELWSILGEKKSIHLSPWPKYSKSKTIDSEIKIAVQINGKVRSEIVIDINTEEKDIKNIVLKDKNLESWLKDKEIRKIIYVKGRIINIVI